MGKNLYIAEKPSVAREFANVLKINGVKRDGYIESDDSVITWCVGHLVNMSYPDKYDEKLKKWEIETLPFIPDAFKYEVIDGVAKQFAIVSSLLKRDDVETIYVCTDSGREGEYIYRLVDMLVGVEGKNKKRVWIDSQTEEEIKRGIDQAKDLSEYDNLSDAAYLRAIEDYLIGINYSRIFTLTYGNLLSNIFSERSSVIAIGRVMTCVLGMIVSREREIRDFVKSTFYKLNANSGEMIFRYKVDEKSKYNNSHKLFDDTGFKKEEDVKELIAYLKEDNEPVKGMLESVKKSKEKKNPPLLFNLAELQNECSKRMKISPNETLKIVQELYEKKLVTYPRTDARVISTAVASEIHKNLRGLLNYKFPNRVKAILENGKHTKLAKTKYVDDKKITDHYAIIPTGAAIGALKSLGEMHNKIYEMIVRRFIAIFEDSAEYNKLSVSLRIKTELFVMNSKMCIKRGFLDVLEGKKEEETESVLANIKKNDEILVEELEIKEGETSPPKRYNSGSIILAMENAGKLIEDEELREQIKGSGIGTSATRAEILNKLERIEYINLNKKTQILTPELRGEMIYDIVRFSVPSLLEPKLTASWEKGLSMIENGEINKDDYMVKLKGYVEKNMTKLKESKNQKQIFNQIVSILDKPAEGKCKNCGGEIRENRAAFYCNNFRYGCEFKIWKEDLKDYGIVIDEDFIKKIMTKDEVVEEVSDEKYKITIKNPKKGGVLIKKEELEK